jgi:signal transduction histidine kinase
MAHSSVSPAGEALRETIRRERELLDELSRNPATTGDDLAAVARLITERGARLLGVERTGIWLFAEDETELRCIDQYNLSTGAHSSGAVIYEHELRDEFHALKTSLYVDASEPYTDPRTAGYVDRYLSVNGITSMLDVVIRFGGKNLGTLCFEHVGEPHVWQDHEIDFGMLVGSQLSLLLERRARAETEVERREMHERLLASQEFAALKSRFLANVSHEFRTPLTLLLGPVDDLLGSEADAPTAWQKEQLAVVRRSALRLLKLVDALLDFVRLEGSGVTPVFEPVALDDLTRELCALFGSAAAKVGLSLRVDCEKLPAPAWVDRDMWEKIVHNLLSNALKYTLAGVITVTLRGAGDRAALEVKDTGVGIPEEALPHLFERFYRVPNTRGRTMEGAGIGLALVKELVELHEGTLHVESAPGVGSTFRVEIPREPARAAQQAPGARAPARRGPSPLVEEAFDFVRNTAPPPCAPRPGLAAQSKDDPARHARILVADDNADMRAYLTRLLAKDYDVVAVGDGAAALREARASPPDLVLSDVMMPELDGLGLLRALRAGADTRTLPVVLVSARAGDEAAVEALGVGADDYLCKPFSARELLARVATHLALARARREAAESELKDVFLGIAGHELRTPLTTLKLRVQLARQKLAAARPDEAAAQLDQVHRAIARMERLASTMLEVSAIKAGRVTLAKERCDLATICRAAAAEQELAIDREVTLDLPADPVSAVVDRERVAEVIAHLLSNALKYSPRDRPVTLSLRARGGEAVITVQDRGPGIAAAELPHIFDRFYRVPEIDVQVGSRIGLGLGLFVARALVEQHGGEIVVETSPREGSTFVVTLPRGMRDRRASDRAA